MEVVMFSYCSFIQQQRQQYYCLSFLCFVMSMSLLKDCVPRNFASVTDNDYEWNFCIASCIQNCEIGKRLASQYRIYRFAPIKMFFSVRITLYLPDWFKVKFYFSYLIFYFNLLKSKVLLKVLMFNFFLLFATILEISAVSYHKK